MVVGLATTATVLNKESKYLILMFPLYLDQLRSTTLSRFFQGYLTSSHIHKEAVTAHIDSFMGIIDSLFNIFRALNHLANVKVYWMWYGSTALQLMSQRQ